VGVEENKRIVKVILEDLFCETAYQYYAETSEFEGHMIDYRVSPLHGRDNAAASLEGKAPHQTTNLKALQKRGERGIQALFPDGSTRALISLTAEDDRVVAEYFVHGGRTSFRDDRENNFYCTKVFELRDGLVVNIREYIDSAYMNDFSAAMHEAFGKSIQAGGSAEAAAQAAAERSSWGSSWLLANTAFDLGQGRIPIEDAELEANKQVARTVVTRWGEPEMFDLLTDTIMFNNQVDLETTPALGRSFRDKEAFRGFCERTREAFPGGLSRTIRAITAEENRVCVEDTVRGRSVVRPDEEFVMATLKICVLRAGKVFRIRQFVDSGYCRAYSPGLIDYIFGVSDALPAAAS
jgi:ketosteroid isomerase-like protein